jgi:UDP-GlcNAc:undecaprenyl-phosphate GlcNAc-1-phosphate transferase
VIAIAIASSGLLIVDVASPLASIPLGFRVSLALTAFWIVGVTNAYNFMDGINGIASVQAIVSGGALAVLFARHGDAPATIVSLALAAGAAGFLPWNFPKARVFMGDVGSSAIGFLIAMLAVRLSTRGGSLLEGALPLLPFLFDTGFTLSRRIALGDRWWTAHRTHLYQKLTGGGLSHTVVTALWGSLALGSAVVAIVLRRVDPAVATALVLLLLGLHIALATVILRR